MTEPTKLSRRVTELPPSETLALAAKARALRAQGHDVVDFSVGEPDFVSPDAVLRAGKAAIDAGDTHYPPVGGTPALKQAILARVRRDYGHDAAPEQVLVSNGAKQVLYNLILSLVDPGDEVVLGSPYWVSYPAIVALAGGRAVPVPTLASEGFRLDPEAVAQAIGPRTRALILNSPSNPTGAVMSPEDVDAVVRLALDRGVVVLSDEIYSSLVFGAARHRSALSVAHPRAREGVVLVDGVSKAYAMTGWRIGYAVGPKDLIAAAAKLQGQSTSGACTIAQAAAAAGLRECEADTARMRDAFARRRDVMLDGLRAIPGLRVPEAHGAFYAFPDVSAYYGSSIGGAPVTGSQSLSDLLLERAHVAAVPGAAFGADAHLRISYALDEAKIREGLARTARLLALAEPGPRA